MTARFDISRTAVSRNNPAPLRNVWHSPYGSSRVASPTSANIPRALAHLKQKRESQLNTSPGSSRQAYVSLDELKRVSPKTMASPLITGAAHVPRARDWSGGIWPSASRRLVAGRRVIPAANDPSKADGYSAWIRSITAAGGLKMLAVLPAAWVSRILVVISGELPFHLLRRLRSGSHELIKNGGSRIAVGRRGPWARRMVMTTYAAAAPFGRWEFTWG